MSYSNDSDLHSESDWQAQLLRASLFFSPPPQVNPVDWWQEVTGTAPANRTLQPKAGIQQDEGEFGVGKLTMARQPVRVDWVYTADEGVGFDDATLGPFSQSVNLFLDAVSSWLPTSPDLSRLAFGAVLVLPVPNRIVGYQELSRYLHAVKVAPEESSDLVYQINRKRDSQTEIPGLKINRLSKWSVIHFEMVNLQMGQRQVHVLPATESFACRLELDINTVPDFESMIPRDHYAALFREFVELGKEIASEGDIP